MGCGRGESAGVAGRVWLQRRRWTSAAWHAQCIEARHAAAPVRTQDEAAVDLFERAQAGGAHRAAAVSSAPSAHCRAARADRRATGVGRGELTRRRVAEQLRRLGRREPACGVRVCLSACLSPACLHRLRTVGGRWAADRRPACPRRRVRHRRRHFQRREPVGVLLRSRDLRRFRSSAAAARRHGALIGDAAMRLASFVVRPSPAPGGRSLQCPEPPQPHLIHHYDHRQTLSCRHETPLGAFTRLPASCSAGHTCATTQDAALPPALLLARGACPWSV